MWCVVACWVDRSLFKQSRVQGLAEGPKSDKLVIVGLKPP